jgi:hypothetical protein
MMGDMLFVIRMLVLTVIVVIVMQVKIGDTTIEAQVQSWLSRSPAVETLREVAHSAVKVVSVGYKMAISLIDAKLSASFNREQMAGSRSIDLGLRRSESYEREKAEKERNAQSENAEEANVEGAPDSY